MRSYRTSDLLLSVLPSVVLSVSACSITLDLNRFEFPADVPDGGSDALEASVEGGAFDDGAVDDGAADDAASGPVLAAAVREISDWACREWSRCESKRGRDLTAAEATRVCHPEWVRRSVVEPLLAEVAAGRVQYDPAAVDDCIQQLPEDFCQADALAQSVSACRALFTGDVAQGEACDWDVVCAPELICVGDRAGQCRGSCEPPGRQAAPCVDDGDCDEAYSCVDGGCNSRGTKGLSCRRDADCRDGHYCDAGQCAKQAASGEPCISGRSESCAGTALCVVGEEGPRCSPGVTLGGKCTGELPCAPGTRCVNGTCGVVAEPGASCNSNAQCPFGRYCGEGCVPRPSLGESCDDESVGETRAARCIEGICVDGTCQLGSEEVSCAVEPGSPFAPCEGYCADGSCAPSKASGDTCSDDAECESGLECREGGEGDATCQPFACGS